MPPVPPHFVLSIPPIGAGSNTSGQQGSFVCTEPAPRVYLLSFSNPPDNRLTPTFNQTFLLALDIIEHKLPKGVVVTTSSILKFYSNGLDFENAIRDPTFFPGSLFPLWRRLITYPMPTVALLNGHAFAGGLMTAMFHDYRIMNPHKGFLCLNELDFGAALQPTMASVFRTKLSMTSFRNMVLESRRYPALESLKEGIIDGLGGIDETLAFIKEYKLVEKAQSSSYANLKEELYREVIQDIDEAADRPRKAAAQEQERERRYLESGKRVDDYSVAIGAPRSKL